MTGRWQEGDVLTNLLQMKSIRIPFLILVLSLRLIGSLHAQEFTELEAGLKEVSSGALDWGDYDNDNDLDLVISGYNTDDHSEISTRIYTNNGDETFSEALLLDSIYKGSLDWVDLDSDGYLDVVMNGSCMASSDEVAIFFDYDLPARPGIEIYGPNTWYLACTNDSATAYRWYYNDNLIAGAEEYLYVAGTNEGKYEGSISENGICFAMSDPIWIPLGTGMDENVWQDLRIYPNPTPVMFILEMDNGVMGELIIDIFGGTGKKIINITLHKETRHFMTQIDLSNQPPAMYLVGLMLENYATTKSLLVE